MIHSKKFKINARTHQIFHQKTFIKSLDFFSQLSLTSIFPKIFWSPRDEEKESIAFGSLIELDQVPQIESLEQINGDSFDPIFFGAVAYSYPEKKPPWYAYFKDRCFILPKHLFEKTKEGYFYHRFALSESSFEDPLDKASKEMPSLALPKLVSRDDFPSQTKWLQMITELIEHLKKKKLRKVVLARQTQLNLDQDLDPYQLLKHLHNTQKNSSLFSFQFHPQMTFMGASPENLFMRKGRLLKSEALAGSHADQSHLYESQKDYKEFSFVTDYLSQSFQALCSDYKKTPHQVVSLGYLNHLKSLYEGPLLNSITDEHLVRRLHPTPALCGTPQKEANTYIESVEPFERGWYAAPIGCVSEHQTHFIVGIRSCLATLRQMNLITGCGVIQDSNPQKEWEELEIKLSPYLNFLKDYVSA